MAFTSGPWHLGESKSGRRYIYAHSEQPLKPEVKLNKTSVTQEMIDNAELMAASPDLYVALNKLLVRYVELVNCGDCGSWNPEEEFEVKHARTALAKAVKP
jgi:hypothetical protein